jgi:prolyl-tRNA synthetase
MAKDKNPKKNELGITVKKADDFSEWYTQVIRKADLADYTAVSGCIVYKPGSYSIWEKIKDVVDARIKAMGVQNAYFPLFIPESLLQKEEEHVEGFTPEVAWVTHAGETKLGERLAVRPTSETIMYDSYAKWIRSHNDLPLRYNQWNNVVRWEFKHPTPFLRSREFLWNEGHTCFATREEAEQEVNDILVMYKDVLQEYFALPALDGKKSNQEKFAGAEYTTSLELIMPNGKAIQGPDAHFDGQNFAKAFDISFVDQNEKKQFVWQNTWAITTRMIGVLIAIHGDDKGLVLPPKLASVQAVIVPILFDKTKDKVLKKAREIADKLAKNGISVHLDDREGYSPGWKYNEWEVKGVPLRIELGPRDLENDQVMMVRRDNCEKQALPIAGLSKEVELLLAQMHDSMYKNALKLMKDSIVKVDNPKATKIALDDKKILFAPWCGCAECEAEFKDKFGAKSLNSPFKQPRMAKDQQCFACSKEATAWFYMGKSY